MTTIRTDRLILRPWVEEDLEPFANLNADPIVREFYPSLMTRQESDLSVKRMNDHITKFGWGFWAASLIETDQFIGLIGLEDVYFEAHFIPILENNLQLNCVKAPGFDRS